MFDYFDKKFEGMQAQINKNVKPPVKKYKKTDGQNTKAKGNKDQLDFNTEISFAKQECQHQISRSIIEPASLTSVAANLKKIIKLIKLADRSPVGESIVQEYKPNRMASDSDDAQKIRQAEKIAIRKRKVKTYASFTQLSSSTISKALSFQFQNTSFQNVYSLPIPIKTKFEYNSNNPFNNLFKKPFNSTFRFTRTPKSTNTWLGCADQGYWRKY